METSVQQTPIICSIGDDSSGDPSIKKTVEERIKELLENFKNTQSIIYVNIENLVLDDPKKHKHGGRSRSRHGSRSRSRHGSRSKSRDGSRSRSRSHSGHRKGKHHNMHHSKGHRFPLHFLHRYGHHPHHFKHHHGHHHYPPHYYYSSEAEETNVELTAGAETTDSAVEDCCRGYGRRHKGWNRKHSRSRSRGQRSRSKSHGRKTGKKCQKRVDEANTKESEVQEVIMVDDEEQPIPTNPGDLETQFDSLNVSKTS